MKSYLRILSVCVALIVFGAVFVHGEPEPMARPTRPEVFSNPEELRRYLDHVSDYYSLNGKARYGKRGSNAYAMSDADRVLDVARAILENSQQPRRLKIEKRKQEEGRYLDDLESTGNANYASRMGGRPCHVYDVVEK